MFAFPDRGARALSAPLAQNSADNIVAVVDADQGVDSRNTIEDRFFVTLNEAPRYDHALERAVAFALDRLADDFIGLSPGRVEEAAGVDDRYIRVIFVGRNRAPSLSQLSEHLLGVDEVLGTAKRYKGY